MTDAVKHLTRYYVCIEDPKGTDRWAIRGEVRAASPSAAKLLAHDSWPDEGPFEVMLWHGRTDTPPDVIDLFKL